eukprot:TRINITY_DN301_c0_g1_i6.p2 TRINITY_DN301_c0_g1~~TRINITY_DN301_c0_g1_i6.p2  ORF type:complete len:104 (+),score=17.73 TRINITY_DN301_c0_g1_i6:425-736(+)
MAIAEEKMNIPAIIDGDELAEGNVSDKQMVLYLSLLYNAFTEKNKGQTVESLMNKVCSIAPRSQSRSQCNPTFWLCTGTFQKRCIQNSLPQIQTQTPQTTHYN